MKDISLLNITIFELIKVLHCISLYTKEQKQGLL